METECLQIDISKMLILSRRKEPVLLLIMYFSCNQRSKDSDKKEKLYSLETRQGLWHPCPELS